MISAVADRIHYAEARRTNFTVLAGVLVAGGVALLTFILDKNLPRVVSYPILIGSIESIILGIILLLAFARQTNRYPWTAATKTWKWFYRDALPDQGKFDLSWKSLFRFGSEKTKLQGEYNRQLPIFSEKMKSLEDFDLSLDQDMQQLYVLHINEKFKNVHLTQLRSIMEWGVFLIALSAMVSAFVGWKSDERNSEGRVVSVRSNGIVIDAKWRLVSSSSIEGPIIIDATLQNTSPYAVSLPRWVAKGAGNVEIPVSRKSTEDGKASVRPREIYRYSVILRPIEPMKIEKLSVSLPDICDCVT